MPVITKYKGCKSVRINKADSPDSVSTMPTGEMADWQIGGAAGEPDVVILIL